MILYRYKITVHKIYDGDSFTDVDVDLGFHKLWGKRKLRLFGIDTPEVTKDQREAGIIVRDYVRSIVFKSDLVVMESMKDESSKYGDLKAIIYCDGMNLNQHLLDIGYAKEYFGGTKDNWTPEELMRITQ